MALINWSSYLSAPGNIAQGQALAMRGIEGLGQGIARARDRKLRQQALDDQAAHLRALDEQGARRLNLAERQQGFTEEQGRDASAMRRERMADAWRQKWIQAMAAGREADAEAYRQRYEEIVGRSITDGPTPGLHGPDLLRMPPAKTVVADDDPRAYRGQSQGVEWAPPAGRREVAARVSPESEAATQIAEVAMDPWARQRRKQSKAVANAVRAMAGDTPLPPEFMDQVESVADNLMTAYNGDSEKTLAHLSRWITDRIHTAKKRRRVGRVAAGVRPSLVPTATEAPGGGDLPNIEPRDELGRRKFARMYTNDIYNKYGVADTVKSMESLAENIRVLSSRDPRDTAAQKQAIKQMISAVESGRVSDKDFALMVSGESLWGQLRKLYHSNVGAFNDELDRYDPKQLERLTRAARSSYRTRTAQYKDALNEVLALRESLQDRLDAYRRSGNAEMAANIEAELFQVDAGIRARFPRDMWKGKLGGKRKASPKAAPKSAAPRPSPQSTGSNPFLE